MMRAWRRVPFVVDCLVVGVVAIILTTMFVAHIGDARARLTASDLALPLAALGAAASCLWRSRHCEDGVRPAWGLLGLATLSWGLGQSFSSYYEVILHKSAPFPSAADVGYLIAVPLFAAGLLKVPGA